MKASSGTSTLGGPPSRRTALTIALTGVAVYGYLASVLSTISSALSNTDEEEATSYFLALKTLISIGALLNFGSSVACAIGALSIWTESRKLLRLYSLYSLFSLGGEMILFVTVCLTTVWSGGSTVVSKLCETFAGHDLTVLGIGCICIVRGWAAIQILSFYTSLVKSRRMRSRTRSSGAGASSSKRKIYLLPQPIASTSTSSSSNDRSSEQHHEREDSVPLLKLTPSSPARSAFPPIGHSTVVDLQPDMPPSPVDDEPSNFADDYIVYAPVRMTKEQAQQLQARELSLPKHSSKVSTAYKDSPRASTSLSSAPSSVTALRAVAGNTVAALEQVVRDR